MNAFRPYFLLFLLFLQSNWGAAQVGDLEGKVTGEGADKALSEVKIKLIGTSVTAKTDSNGNFHIEDLAYGVYSLKAFAFGFRPELQRIRVDSSKVDIKLHLDSNRKELGPVEVTAGKEDLDDHMAVVDEMGIYAAKKSEVVHPGESGADRATDKARELFSSVSGIIAQEDGDGGLQMDIGSRGLDPSRSAHFNMRQNGYDISADALGYPEAYYTPPSQAVERIEVVRGAASLQYGPQFGGMVNFELRGPPKKEGIRARSHQTLGSFKLFNSYVEVGGRKGRTAFQSFFHRRRGNGWRPNSEFHQRTGYLELEQRLSPNTKLSLEYTHMDLLRHQPGGLTDRAFLKDPSISLRERNWFQVRWNLGALRFQHRFGPRARLESRTFGLMGSRNAVGILTRIDRADHGGERLLLKDRYRNFGNETRFLQHYELFGKKNVLLLGGRYYQGRTFRRQGPGTEGKGPDFHYVEGKKLDSKFRFPSRNIAFFAENVFRIGERWTLTPGIRFERIRTASKGWYHQVNRDLAGNVIYEVTIQEERENERRFFLYGVGLGFRVNPDLELYGNFSTNYRAIGFNDMRLVNPNFKVDPNLKDESGHTADLGIRGELFGHLNLDVSFFTLYYSDRIGAILKVDSNTFSTYRLRTNVSDSRTYGVESYVELELAEWIREKASLEIRPFINLTRQRARYIHSKEAAFQGNRVEMAPEWSLVTGLKGSYKGFEWRYQYQYISHQYADATNAISLPSAEVGLIPAYRVSDASIGYGNEVLEVKVGVHNLFDRSYFTHRATGYSGPGIVPAPPRNYYVTLSFFL